MEDKEPKQFKEDFLTKEELEHDLYLKGRMEKARDERNKARDEFDGMEYLKAYDRDTKAGLAYIAPVLNDGENPISTGTTRQANISLISRAISYNYETEFVAFDKSNDEIVSIGPAIGVAVSHANYLDGEDEKMKTRINELFTHGDVIEFEDWVTEYRMKKSHPPFDGKIKGVSWSEKKEKFFEGCRRHTVEGRRFYFGDIFTDTIDRQPFCFEINHIPYHTAKMMFGEWERWKYVPIKDNDDFDWSSYAESWQLEDAPDGSVTVNLYVDLPNNEMQIYLSGVPMLPMEFPMKWEHDRYPWAHQGAEPIRTGFIYHRSFVRTLLNMQDLENDMWRVIVMLAWRAALPPLANQTGQVITRKDIMAGEIIDVDADYLKPIFDGSLQNTGFVREVAGMIRENMTSRSVPETKQGLQLAGTNTATEVTQLNKEAEIAISMNLTAAANIASKVDWLRAANLLQFAFKKDYKATSLLPGQGGVVNHIVKVVDSVSSSRDIMKEEDSIEKLSGRRTKITELSKDARNTIERLEARSVPKPKASSALERLELQNMFATASALFGPELDKTFLEDMFRSAYQVPPEVKLRAANPMPQVPQGSPPKQAAPMPGQAVGNNMPV